MKLTQQPNLRAEDFPDFKEAERLFTTLNPFILDLVRIFDQNVDYETNIKSVTRSFSSTGVTLPLRFSWPFPKFSPIALQVVKATVDSTPSVLLAGWSYNASISEISVSSLMEIRSTGVVPIAVGSKYAFTIRATI